MKLGIRGKCFAKFTVFIVVVNLLVVYVALAMDPVIHVHEPRIEYDVHSSDYYVVISGEGWFKPPLFINVDHALVELLVGNITLQLAWINLTSDNTPVLFEFNTSREFRSEELNVSVFPEVKLYVDLKGYVPIPANAVALDHNGCYILFYYLAEQLNTTVQLCYYYVDPVLTIINSEPADLKALLETLYVDGKASSKEYVVKRNSNMSIEFSGVTKILIREEKMAYPLFEIKVENGKAYLRLSNLIYVVIAVIDISLLLSAVKICGRKQVHKRKPRRKQARGNVKLNTRLIEFNLIHYSFPLFFRLLYRRHMSSLEMFQR